MSLISALYLTFASCSENFCTSDGLVWGTSYHIVYSSPRDLSDSIVEVTTRIDRSLSKFNTSSEVSRINNCASDTVGEDFRRVFRLASEINKLSDGVYDPTVGPLCELWGFGNAEFTSAPSDSAIEAALLITGIQQCTITPEGVIYKKDPTTQFDFSSIAKGYGIDQIGEMLLRNGAQNFMVEIGGEILARGLNPRGKPWRIQIDAPVTAESPEDLHTPLTMIELGPELTALATSGNYRNRRSDGTLTFGHTISPITGRPVTSPVLSATIIASDCATADAMATAVMASPSIDEALDMLEKTALRAILVVQSDSLTHKIIRFPE